MPGNFRLRRLCAAVAVGMLLAGAAVTPARAEPDPASLTGTVTDTSTGDPIAGACVSAQSYYSGEMVANVCTGADGTYALTVPAEGQYRIRATADTYRDLWAYNKTSAETAAGVYLSPTWSAQPIDFRLFHETATVSGRITDSTGAPVQYANIRVVPEDSWDVYSSPYAYADADGRYSVTGVIPGRYRVVFIDNVLGQVYARASETREGATIFDLGDGASVTVDESFLPLGAVEVTVVDAASGAPVTRACVRSMSVRESVCNAADGVYRLLNAQPGTWEFTVSAGTHRTATVILSVARGETTRVTVSLTRAAAIVTRVVDRRTNQPVTGVCIILTRPDSPGLSANQPRHCTETDGRLVVPLTDSPGTYQLFVETRDTGYGAQWVGVFGGTGNRELARSVTVAPDTNVTIPPIRLDGAGSITGIARKPDGTPATGTCALPYAPDARGLWRERPACTDAQGRYTISGLGPYHWPVLFMGDAWIWSGNRSNRYAATKVNVRAGQSSTMDAVVPAGATVTGLVRDAAGAVVNADVRAFNAVTGDYAGPTTGAYFGNPYQLRGLTAQRVRIEYALSGANYTVCWYDGTTDPSRATPVRVPAGAAVPLDLTGCG